MRNLFLLFSKFGTLILFILLELISLFLIVNYNNTQKEIFLYSSNLFSGRILNRYDATMDYFNLNTINDSIQKENARFLEKLHNQYPEVDLDLNSNSFDSIVEVDYRFIPAKICNKTLHLRNNRITLDKGMNNGIDNGMGVISENGVIGVIRKINGEFSSVIPIINTQLHISAKVLGKNYSGDLTWQPYDERFMLLEHIPKHADVAIGDSIVTSGYSTIFPPDIEIGKISDIKLPAGENYFKIKVRLFEDIATLEHVYIVDYTLKEFKKEMEMEIED